MLKINTNLLNTLPHIMGDRVVDFTDKVFGPNRKHMWNQQKNKNWNILTGYDLARIANTYHIPLSFFFLQEGENHLYTSKDQLVYTDNWVDVSFTPEAICNEYRKDKPSILLKTFADSMDTTSSCLYRWFAPEGKCTMTVQQALLCTYRLDLPTDFLFTDPNAPLPSHLKLNTAAGTERTINEMREMREHIRLQQRTIHSLQEENKRMRDGGHEYSYIGEAVGEYNTRIRPFMFNQGLWDSISVVMNTSKRDIERRTGIKSTVVTPTVIQLVKLCNTLSVSTHHFIVRSVNTPELRDASYYQSNFTPVSYDPTRLDALFRVGNILDRKRKDTLELLGVNDMVSRRWTKPDSTLNVIQLIDICNQLDVLPSICIDDTNRRNYGTTITELLLEENMALRLKLADLENTSS